MRYRQRKRPFSQTARLAEALDAAVDLTAAR